MKMSAIHIFAYPFLSTKCFTRGGGIIRNSNVSPKMIYGVLIRNIQGHTRRKRQIHMICAYKSPETYIIHNQNAAYQITYIQTCNIHISITPTII